VSRRGKPDLPLFDLPLHEASEDEDELFADDPVDVPAPASPALSQSRLFDENDAVGFEPLGDLDEDGLDEDGPDADGAEDGDGTIGVLDRLLGGFIDLSIHAAVLLLVVGATWIMGVPLELGDTPAVAVFLLLFSLLYTGVPLAFWGQTPGMMRVGHVARAGSGEPLTFGQTARRWIGALLTLALAGLPLLLALGSKRSLADRMSGSYTEPS